MTTAVLDRPIEVGARSGGGVSARRAMVRWAWRLFRREWRQQLLILALIIVAVAATVVGSAVATDTPPPANAGFGTADHLAAYSGSDPHLTAEIQGLQHRFGNVDVIENQTLSIPGSVNTYQLRSQSPHGPYGQPMLSLVSGSYPVGPGQVAVTNGLASAFNLRVGDIWHQGGSSRRVVGIVQNPQSLLDEFALVAPGQITAPTQVTVLFDGGASAGSLPNVHTPSASGNTLNPETIVLALDTVGMLLIALVGVAGFTVLAQRRLRSIGMLGALGATDKNIRLVVRANGAAVGVVGALIGAAVGLVAWLAYRPRLESNAHHLIGTFQLPWVVIGVSMALAVVATLFAASRPARSITRLPIVSALSGRPAPPKQVHRSAVPGVILLVVAFLLFTVGGSRAGSGGGMPEVVLGFVVLIAAVILLSPFCLAVLARIGGRAPIAVRLALRDLARYRARSASALGAISLGVLIAVVICVVAAGRYGNVLDYAGPNLASNQLVVSASNGPANLTGPGNGGAASTVTPSNPSIATDAQEIAAALGSHNVTELDTTSASLEHAAPGRNWNGPIFIATPALLRAFGIRVSSIDPTADILSMRPGLSTTSDMQLVYGDDSPKPGQDSSPCPAGQCLANPVIQTVSALPSGTSAPNTLITEHAVRQLGLQSSVSPAAWFIQTPQPLTAAQIKSAQLTAATAGLAVETKSSAPSSAEIINWATVFGILLALGILAMSIGLIRSETAGDLRTLSATGAGSSTRRTLTAATAGALALLGAVLGTVAGYVAAIGFFRSSAQNGGLAALSSTPTTNLLIILIGMPLIAAVGGWLLAGREVPAISRTPFD